MAHIAPSAAIIGARKTPTRPKYESIPLQTFSVHQGTHFNPLSTGRLDMSPVAPTTTTTNNEVKVNKDDDKVSPVSSRFGSDSGRYSTANSYESMSEGCLLTPPIRSSVADLSAYFEQVLLGKTISPPSYRESQGLDKVQGQGRGQGVKIQSETGLEQGFSDDGSMHGACANAQGEQVDDIIDDNVSVQGVSCPAAPPCSPESVVAPKDNVKHGRDNWVKFDNGSSDSFSSASSVNSVWSGDLNPFEDGWTPSISSRSSTESFDSARWAAFSAGLPFVPKAPLYRVKAVAKDLHMLGKSDESD